MNVAVDNATEAILVFWQWVKDSVLMFLIKYG
jgi:hypothetical protein